MKNGFDFPFFITVFLYGNFHHFGSHHFRPTRIMQSAKIAMLPAKRELPVDVFLARVRVVLVPDRHPDDVCMVV